MRRTVRRALPVGVVLAAFFVAACGPATATLVPVIIPPTPEPTLTAGIPTQTVTLGDNGNTLVLAPGDEFLLDLGDQYTWTVTVADSTVVGRVLNITVIKGAQGVYQALKSGDTVLTASGDPLCRQATPPCEQPSILFTLQIVVQ